MNAIVTTTARLFASGWVQRTDELGGVAWVDPIHGKPHTEKVALQIQRTRDQYAAHEAGKKAG